MKAFTLTVTAACLLLVGCNKSAEESAEHLENKMDQVSGSATARMENAADSAEAHVSNAMGTISAAITPTPTPQEFIDAAAKSDIFEIQAAKLAAIKASSPDVKAFAQQMLKAHTDSTAKIKAAAGKLTPNPAPTKDQAEDLADLSKLSGTKFDEEYIDGQVDAHESALSLMQAFARDGADAKLKAAAGAIAPVVENHLKMARDLENRTDK